MDGIQPVNTGNAFRADMVAVYDRDPATSRFIDPLLRSPLPVSELERPYALSPQEFAAGSTSRDARAATFPRGRMFSAQPPNSVPSAGSPRAEALCVHRRGIRSAGGQLRLSVDG